MSTFWFFLGIAVTAMALRHIKNLPEVKGQCTAHKDTACCAAAPCAESDNTAA